MALDTDERDPKNINESATIPNGGFIEHDVCLPDYTTNTTNDETELSPLSQLILTDCHIAMEATLHKARLIIFEIARRNRPFHRRYLKTIILRGSVRDLDEILSSMSSGMKQRLTIIAHASLPSRTDRVLENSLVAHESFKDSSTKLKRSFLRLEKAFVQGVLQPLKQALIDRNTPNFTALIAEADQCSIDIKLACQKRRDIVKAIKSEIEESEGYREAEKIESLDWRARRAGFNWLDKKYEELDSDVFDHADGPSSLIAYLENWLKGHPVKLEKTCMGYPPLSARYISPQEQPKPLKRKANERGIWLANH